VGSAGQGNFGIGQCVGVRRAALDQRDRLQALDGGARENWPVDIAERQDNFAGGVHNGDRAAMLRFGNAAARDFDEHGIGHVRKPPEP
jgi:hypothetical protein